MLTYETIKMLCKTKGVTITGTEKELGFSRGSLCKIDTSKPSMEKVQKLADYFGVSVDYLLSGKEESIETGSALSKKDERDISRRLEQALEDLEGQQEGLMFDGEPLDEETKELLKISLENSIRIAKLNAKQKFTPKKYRKTGDN